MANFGLKELFVVEPYEPAWREARSAVGAGEVMRSAIETRSVAEAIADATLVTGTTSGHGRSLSSEPVSIDGLEAWLGRFEPDAPSTTQPQAAMLFGSEKTGLSNENLSYCRAIIRIPTAAECPSMNLGQAVAVCCHELARMRGSSLCAEPGQVHVSEPASIQSIEHVFERAVRVLDASGYLKTPSRSAQLLKLRRCLVERGLTSHDAKILGGVLAQIEWKFSHPGKGTSD